MPNPATDDNAILRFSDAILRIWDRRGDFVAIVMASHRDLAEKRSGVDPIRSACDLQNAVDRKNREAQTAGANHARVQLVSTVLLVWYKVPPDLKCAVMQAVREIAIEKGQDPLQAMISADVVLSGARNAGQSMSEQYAAIRAKQAELDWQRDDRERQRILARIGH